MTQSIQEVQSILSRPVDFSKKAIAYLPLVVRKEIESFSMPLINHHTAFDIQEKYISTVKSWFTSSSRTYVRGLEKFPFVYVTSGTLQLLHDLSTFVNEKITFREDDFPGYHLIRTPYTCFHKKGRPDKENYLLCSHPFNGGVIDLDIMNDIDAHPRVILDGAFFGTIDGLKIDLNDNIQIFTYSFSKMFGLQYYRIGIVFSKIPSLPYEVHKKYAYQNAYAQSLMTHLLSKYMPHDIIDLVYPIQQRICQQHGLVPSECIWSAYTKKGEKISLFPFYKKDSI